MLRSHLIVILRNVAEHKLHAAINILGLAVGVACCLLIGTFMAHELGFDRHYADADRIYRVSPDFYETGDNAGWSHPAANVQPAAALLLQEFSEIEQTARIWGQRAKLAREGDAPAAYLDRLRWADQSFFDIFDLDWLQGDPAEALARPFTIVLTETLAGKYFGDEDPLGQTLLLEDSWPLEVTGVIRDLREDTHLSADAIASMDSGFAVLGYDYPDNWSFRNFHTYVRLREGASIASVEERLPELVQRHKRPDSTMRTMTATKLTNIHLRSRRSGELETSGSIGTVYTFGVIALCILLIACCNFVNLSTAGASQRAKEVGVRKVLGSDRSRLTRQFLGESVLFASVATVLALALVELVLPFFGSFLGRTLVLDLGDFRVLAAVAAFALSVGVLAGSYPAFYLSAFEPARVLKSDLTRGRAGALFRKALVTAQFSIAILLTILVAIVHAQTSFARDIDLGFDAEGVVIVSPIDGLTGARWRTFKQELLAHPGITHVAAGSMYPPNIGEWLVRGQGGSEQGRRMHAMSVGYDFLETYGVKLIAGRSFSEARGTDGFVLPSSERPHSPAAYVLNERAARELGWTPEDALHKWFEIDFAGDFSRAARGPVIGVVEDTYVESVREARKALVYLVPPEIWGGAGPTFSRASIRITGNAQAGTMELIDAKWRALLPGTPLDRHFADTELAALYAAEERQMHVLTAFVLLSTFIASFGLLGLAAYMAGRRSKEIGIRKVAGASAAAIVASLTRDFTKPVLLANLLAWPVAYLIAQRWLEGFAYRIEPSLLHFVGAGGIALVVAWCTVGAIALRAASRRVVDSLRYE
jgi:putative ABC transport system permease protein